MTAQAAPPDEKGMVNLSLHLGATYDELVLAGRDPDRLLVVEVNPNLPRTCSLPPDYTNTLPLDVIDVVVEADGAPYALAPTRPDAIDEAIAEVAGSFVTDGATLQIGIGAVPDMVAARLASGPGGHYGIHGEMFTDGLMRLHRGGQGDQRPQRRLRRGVGHHLRARFRPISTAGWTTTNRWRSCRSRWSTTRPSSPGTTASSRSTAR